MSKLLPSISGVACFLWVSGWTWIFSEGKNPADVGSSQPPISILIDSVRYNVQQPFAFEYSEATPVIAESLLPAIKSVAKSLRENDNTVLSIIGIYGKSENNRTAFPNLGLARAEAVKSMLETSNVPVGKILTEGMETNSLFQLEDKLIGAIYFSFERKKTGGKEEELQVESTADSNAEESIGHEFFYKYGDYKVEPKNLEFLKELRNELRNNSAKVVTITGYSAKDEEGASKIELAEMRAMAVRRYLVDHGVRRVQIKVASKPSLARNAQEMIVSMQVSTN